LFWLVALVMGWPLTQDREQGGVRLLLWVAVFFVSILVHELGHVFMGRYFGSHGSILLYGFGGLAIGSSDLPRRSQRIAVYFAGPLAGFLLVGMLALGLLAAAPNMVAPFFQNVLAIVGLAPRASLPELPVLTASVLQQALWINIFWGLLNLLPIWPLDGGQVARELCAAQWGLRGERAALSLSIALAGLIALHAAVLEYSGQVLIPFLHQVGGMFTAILFLLLAIECYQELQRVRAREPRWNDRWDDRTSWERDRDAWR
jgi:Zn-dependent protease